MKKVDDKEALLAKTQHEFDQKRTEMDAVLQSPARVQELVRKPEGPMDVPPTHPSLPGLPPFVL